MTFPFRRCSQRMGKTWLAEFKTVKYFGLGSNDCILVNETLRQIHTERCGDLREWKSLAENIYRFINEKQKVMTSCFFQYWQWRLNNNYGKWVGGLLWRRCRRFCWRLWWWVDPPRMEICALGNWHLHIHIWQTGKLLSIRWLKIGILAW